MNIFSFFCSNTPKPTLLSQVIKILQSLPIMFKEINYAIQNLTLYKEGNSEEQQEFKKKFKQIAYQLNPKTQHKQISNYGIHYDTNQKRINQYTDNDLQKISQKPYVFQLQEKNSNLQGQVKILKSLNQYCNIKIRDLQQQFRRKTQNEKIRDEEEMEKKLQTQKSQLKERLQQKFQAQKKEFVNFINQLAQKNNAQSKQLQIMFQQKQKLYQKIRSIEQQNIKRQTLNRATQTKSVDRINQVQSLNKSSQSHFFIGSIFQYFDARKSDLIKEILKINNGCNILKTRMRYLQDLKNKTNVHQYIDGIPRIIILIQLENGQIVGAYSQKPMQKSQQKAKKYKDNGLLFNIDRKKYYRLCGNIEGITPKALMYDEYFIVIGNAEIRFSQQQKIIRCNIGARKQFYEANNEKNIQFFGTQQREVNIKGFEVHQIIFEE